MRLYELLTFWDPRKEGKECSRVVFPGRCTDEYPIDNFFFHSLLASGTLLRSISCTVSGVFFLSFRVGNTAAVGSSVGTLSFLLAIGTYRIPTLDLDRLMKENHIMHSRRLDHDIDSRTNQRENSGRRMILRRRKNIILIS
ncbi:hypothetical protein DFH27DRAFT_176948 [Peziza echinospora]|nr:hypothetical protein DFH27DRAFT_176948 [Peziza echinospora]